MSREKRRVKIYPVNPNPLFEQWLTEWREEAAKKGSDMQYCFGKALKSLKKYPLPLNSGRECAILQNFGNRLCTLLDRRLAEHKREHPADAHISSQPDNVGPDVLHVTETTETHSKRMQESEKKEKQTGQPKGMEEEPAAKRKRSAPYVPTPRSGPYALLMTLFTHSRYPAYKGHMLKAELHKFAQPLCDSSFVKPDPGCRYSAWSSMGTLMKKGLVVSTGRGKYTLTSEGESLAAKLKDAEMSSGKVGDDGENTAVLSCENSCRGAVKKYHASTSHACGDNGQFYERETVIEEHLIVEDLQHLRTETTETPVQPSEREVIFTPGSFEVVLLIDTQEATGINGRKGCDDSPLNDLQKQNVISEIRNLKVGDFAWVCRHRTTKKELVLPYIIERKRLDDFAQSIVDGRFREQKFRLKQSGIANLIYLVEKHGKECHAILPASSLGQAAANTQVTDGFIVKYTANHRDTAEYLTVLTRLWANVFSTKILVKCSKQSLPPFTMKSEIISLMAFEEFNKSASKNKNLRVSEMLIKQLIQLHGLSVEKALAVVKKYPTPSHLMAALDSGPDTLLSDISYGPLNRRIGPAIGKTLHRLYTNSRLI